MKEASLHVFQIAKKHQQRRLTPLCPFGLYTLIGSLCVCSGAMPLDVDVASRESVRAFCRAHYSGRYTTVDLDWTGSYDTGDPGTVSQEFRDQVFTRINFYRALAGVSSNIVERTDWSWQAQHAALMMSANGQTSHNPPETWKFYTKEGAAGAHSNLCLGASNLEAVDAYIEDEGPNNAAAGHRWWVLHPQSTEMGVGSVPPNEAGQERGANALWVAQQNPNPSARTRDGFVAWPPPGHLPHDLVYPRWSFTLYSSDDGNLAHSCVSMTTERRHVPLTVECSAWNTIVWRPDLSAFSLDGDRSFTVSVSKIEGGLADTVTYQVTLFDLALEPRQEHLPIPEMRRDDGSLAPLRAITFAKGMFVAIGSADTIATSFDGTSWQQLSVPGTDYLNDIVYGNGVFVAVGATGIATSLDAKDWLITECAQGTAVTFGGGQFIAISQSEAFSSSDGYTWQQTSTGGSNYLLAIAYGNGTYVAVGFDGVVVASSDGLTWSQGKSLVERPLVDIAYGGGRFVATISGGGRTITSTNGLDWQKSESYLIYNPDCVEYLEVASSFLAFAGSMTLTSLDGGATWRLRPMRSQPWIRGVAYGNNTLVAVGMEGGRGCIYQTVPVFDSLRISCRESRDSELSWLSRPGINYRLCRSDDLVTWSATGPQETGDGRRRTRTVDTNNGTASLGGFFRLDSPGQ